jgi:hypothetical protein
MPKTEDGLLNRNRRSCVPLFLTLLLFATALPVAAQVAPPPTNSLPASQSPLGDITAIAADARIWLQDLIKIDTTNPPGNEQAAAKYVMSVLQKDGIASEELPLAPGRSAVVARLRSAAMADPWRTSTSLA